MGKLIRDEKERLELVLSIPGHPKTKEYLRDYQNALFEELSFELEVVHALRDKYFISIREATKLLKVLKEEADTKYEKYVHQLSVLKNHEPALSMPEQRQVLRDTLASLKAEHAALSAQYETVKREEEKKIIEVDKRWMERQDKFADDLIKKLADMTISLVDINGKVIPIENSEAKLRQAATPPGLQEMFGHRDLMRAVAQLAEQNGGLNEPLFNKMAGDFHFHREIKMWDCACPHNADENMKPSLIKELMKQNPAVRQQFQEGMANIPEDGKDIGEVVRSCQCIDESKKKLDDSAAKMKAVETVEKRITTVIGDDKPTSPSSDKDYNPSK